MQWFATTWLGPTVTAVGTPCRAHGSHCADPVGRVKAVAARSAGARSASLDAAKWISDLAATRSQLLMGTPQPEGATRSHSGRKNWLCVTAKSAADFRLGFPAFRLLKRLIGFHYFRCSLIASESRARQRAK